MLRRALLTRPGLSIRRASPSVVLMSSSTDSLRQEFERKLALGKQLPPLEDNASKLEMYALFKQANAGKNTTSKPGMLDFVGKAKWEAWSKLGDMSQEDAMTKYIAIIDNLAKANGVDPANPDAASATPAASVSSSEDLLVSTSDDGLLTLQFNRPARHNAINREMYNAIIDALETSASQSHIKAVLLASKGATFSSGNDLSMFTPATQGQSFEEMAEEGAKLLERFVNAFLTYPKPIVAAVQGPAVGIAVTTLALCDLVYVSDTATFHTPFTALGQSPEACSSILFPRIMGNARANAMLLLGEKMSAQDAVQSGFCTAAFGVADFDKQVQEKVALLLSRYPNSMKQSKALIRSPAVLAELQEVNRRECETLKKLWLSAECMDAVLKFQARKKN
ncbi:hypothetical protein Poli38472_014642 [Pythium oligandrum]|uniref:ACB domain-containing protein n=1 Tax=Pythium oligandrum TaxID=41045 RepID=A0A8K1CIC3_PYTOL|nr:hypothetical protein Poli38472_014642 [Pythium oligandrum]|eukprot:TMW63937.1 hypothetical protein Poli38472_014642 [Pythium oligandrum]